MEKSINRQEIVSKVENCAENCYVFSPAIGKRKNTGGKTHSSQRKGYPRRIYSSQCRTCSRSNK